MREIPRPPERKTVTICIAAVCDASTDDRKIVYCMDRLISGPLGKAETMSKIRYFSGGWNAAVAGDDAEIQAAISHIRRNFMRSQTPTPTTIQDFQATQFVRDGLAERKKDKAEEYVRARFAMSLDEFHATGAARLPAEIHRQAWTRIHDMTVNAEFVISGLPLGFPFLIQTHTDGTTSVHDDFVVIGSGSHLAQSVLLHREHSLMSPLARTLYEVYEAKKYAERQTGVGEKTSIFVQHTDRLEMPSVQTHLWLDAQYKKYAPKAVPDDLGGLPENPYHPST